MSQGQHGEDMFLTTIQVLPRAQSFFEDALYRDGAQIERQVFYALLLDGDLSSPAIDRMRPTVHNIPRETLYVAEGFADSEVKLMRNPQVVACRHLRDYYRVIRKLGPATATADRSLAAYICLARHLLQAAYDRDQQRRFS